MLENIMVVKVGSKSNVKDGVINTSVVDRVCRGIARQRIEGKKPILVVSGAVGLGMKNYGFSKKPEDIDDLQMCAGYGQPILVRNYQVGLKEYRLSGNQILVTYSELDDENQDLYIENGLEHCLINRSIPVVNYNDTTDPSEARKDNDETAFRIAVDSNAIELVYLTDVDGVMDQEESLIKEIRSPLEFLHLCNGKSDEGTGGMRSKLEFAEKAKAKGITVYIGNSAYDLENVLNCDPGTVVRADSI